MVEKKCGIGPPHSDEGYERGMGLNPVVRGSVSHGGRMDGAGMDTSDSGTLEKGTVIPFREHRVAEATSRVKAGAGKKRKVNTGGSNVKVAKNGAGDRRLGEEGVANELVGVAYHLVGVSSDKDVKGEKYGINYDSGKPMTAMKEAAYEDKVFTTKHAVAMDTGAGKANVGIIGEGRTKKKIADSEGGVNEEKRVGVKSSESDAEDLTNDQWDSSEEADLMGEGNSDEEDGDSEDHRELEAEIAEGGGLGGSKGQPEQKRDSESSGNPSGKDTPLSPDQWQSGTKGADMWKPNSGLLSSGRTRLSPTLEGALAKARHPRYALEGELDEKNFPLVHQQLLVGQLVSEHRLVCALAEDQINPRNDDVSSLSCLLERSKFNSFHSYLPDAVVEQVLKDRGILPSLLSLVKPIGIGMKLDRQGPGYWNQTVKKHSQLLKIVRASAESRKIASAADNLCGDDPAIVQRVTITPADSASSSSVSTVVSSAPTKDLSTVAVDDPSIVRISSNSHLETPTENMGTSSAAGHETENMLTSGYESEDPLPDGSTLSVFPSALPSDGGEHSKNLGNLFAAFSSSRVSSAVSAKQSSARDKFLTPPQSPTAALWEGCVAKMGTKGDGMQVSGDEVSSANTVATTVTVTSEKGINVNSDVITGSSQAGVHQVPGKRCHNANSRSTKSVDALTSSKKLSVQELEQMIVSSEEAYFSADSGDNGPQLGSNPSAITQFHSENRSSGKPEVLANSGGLLEQQQQSASDNADPLPTLEKWAWQKGPSSIESWSPGSNISNSESPAADHAAAIAPADGSQQDEADSGELGTSDEDGALRGAMDNHKGEPSVGDLTPGALGDPLDDSQDEQFPMGLGTDLSFLVECFPDLDEVYLEQLLVRNAGNVEETVSMALLSTTAATTPLSPLSGHAYFGHGYETQTSVSSGDPCLNVQVKGNEDTDNDEEVARALQDELDQDASFDVPESGVLHLENGGLHLEDKDDEEIARILQEELNEGDGETESDDVPLIIQHESESGVHYLEQMTGIDGEDDNLVLKLTPSLARQLQNLFGPIQQHLPSKGMIPTCMITS